MSTKDAQLCECSHVRGEHDQYGCIHLTCRDTCTRFRRATYHPGPYKDGTAGRTRRPGGARPNA